MAVVKRLGMALALGLSATVAAGCGHAEYAYDGGYGHCGLVAHGGLDIGLRGVQHVRGGESKRMSFHDPMYSGDETALLLWTSEPAFVYVVNFAPDGSKNIVWPSDAPRRVDGHQRIPEDGGYFRLTGATGQELVAVVATYEEYGLTGDGKATVLGIVESTLGRGDLRKLQSALPPGITEDHASMGIRAAGLELDGQTVHARGGDPVVMLIDLDHRPSEERP
jgi:hypothetical protein